MGVAVALETVDDSLSVGQDLVHVELEIGDLRSRSWQVDPYVIEEVGGGGVGSEGDVVAFTAGAGIGVVELTGLAADRWVVDELHLAFGRAAGSRVAGVLRVAERLSAADNGGIREDWAGEGIGPRCPRASGARTGGAAAGRSASS